MQKTRIIGILLLILALYTLVGMIIDNSTYWHVYNCATLIFSILSGVVLLNKK